MKKAPTPLCVRAFSFYRCMHVAALVEGGGEAARPISSGRLSVLLRVDRHPIDLVIYEGPLEALRPGSADLGAGFPLICFQRLSWPHIATRRCHWRDNRYTSGASTPVLSY